MKAEFIQPEFDGDRFAEHTLPLDVARDLAAYETLLIELSKRLYLQDHPERQRVPKGFAADFHLHLERVDKGSSRPVLSLVAMGALALGGETYFEKARELITECIAAPEGQLPPAFPRDLLAHFNQVGRSLQPGEQMELSGIGGKKAVLTPDRRKHLVLAADQVYEKEIEISGMIEEVDWEKSTFRLRQTDGTRIVVPMPESFRSQARTSGGRYRNLVTVCGVGAFDSWDRLQKVVSVDSLEVQPDYELAARLDELRGLEDGWHDGGGVAPNKAVLDSIASRIVGHYSEKLPLPTVVPTPEGNLLFEWDAAGDPSLDIRLPDLKAEFHAFRPDQGDIEREFDLSVPQGWLLLFEFLTEVLGQRTA